MTAVDTPWKYLDSKEHGVGARQGVGSPGFLFLGKKTEACIFRHPGVLGRENLRVCRMQTKTETPLEGSRWTEESLALVHDGLPSILSLTSAVHAQVLGERVRLSE